MSDPSDFEQKLRQFEKSVDLAPDPVQGESPVFALDPERERLVALIHGIEQDRLKLQEELLLESRRIESFQSALKQAQEERIEWKRMREEFASLCAKNTNLDRELAITRAQLSQLQAKLQWTREQVQKLFVELSRADWFAELKQRVSALEVKIRQIWNDRKISADANQSELDRCIHDRTILEGTLARGENEIRKFQALLQPLLPDDSPYRLL